MVYSREGEMGHLGSSAIHPCHPCPCYLALGPARVLSRVCPSLLPPQQIINLNQDFSPGFFSKAAFFTAPWFSLEAWLAALGIPSPAQAVIVP